MIVMVLMLVHTLAQNAIVGQGNAVKLTVQRNSLPSETQQGPGVWRPDVQLLGGPTIVSGAAGPEQTYTKTSLVMDQKPQEEHWDVKHNITARGFQPGAEATAPSTLKPVAAPSGPAGFRSISAPMSKPGGPATPAGPPQPQMCYICCKPISGVFLQVKGRPIHETCFKCTVCQESLKNVGHFVIAEKLYCQTHDRDAQNQLHGIETPSVQPQGGAPPGMPQGLAQNLAKLSLLQPKGQGVAGPPAPPPAAAVVPPPPADWANRLNGDTAGSAGNAEDFTKEFMKQLGGGSNF